MKVALSVVVLVLILVFGAYFLIFYPVRNSAEFLKEHILSSGPASRLSIIIQRFFMKISNGVYKKPADIKTAKIEINGKILIVELADTNALRAKGLSDRKSMPQDYGMLFVFPKAGNYSFWMKGMLFPLDFVWLKDDTVVDLTKNVAVPGNVLLENWPSFSSRQLFDKVLELNAGAVRALGIQIGDKVKF